AGEVLTMEARPITITRLEIIDWQPPALILDIECSKGTYIRSLAHDLGERSGYLAHLQALVRTRSGPFRLDDSITLEQLADALIRGEAEPYLRPADMALEHYPALTLDEETATRVRHGNAFEGYNAAVSIKEQKLARVYDSDGRFVAIAAWDDARQVWQPVKVFE
ncbi:MAG TPA: tRNA pseudouridine(55) synthase TruB, partial [Ktedonobacteraceae bacterium]|nr:tRNA pseudouridine(55) synthase TruB [Ktedonobacteraceae bacterium]